MSYQLDQVANVTITLESGGLTQAGFGTPLVVGPNGTITEIKTISAASEMTASYGYNTTDPEYLKAVAIFAQSPRVSTARIGKLPNGVEGDVKRLTPTGAWASGSFSLEIQGEVVTETFDTDEATSYGNLATAIAALDDVASATWSGTYLEVTATAGLALSVEVVSFPSSVTALAQAIQAGSSTVESDLNTLTANDKDFYAVLVASESAADVKALVSYANANKKLPFYKNYDALALVSNETSSLVHDLNSASESRAIGMYQSYANKDEQPDAALAGKILPFQPGEISWKGKTLVGISAESFTAGQDAELISKKINLVVTSNSVNFTKEGTVAEGEFADIIRGIDWTEARIQENILSLVTSVNKIPYTTAGMRQVAARISEVLRQGVLNGLYVDGYEVTVPAIEDVSAIDKSNRVLNNVRFTATLAGAIHKVNVTGTVSV